MTDDQTIWEEYKHARNHVNNEIKKAKQTYFTTNLENAKSNPRKKWNLINELSSRHCNKSGNITEIQVGEELVNTPVDIAEAFNKHFSSVGESLASEIPISTVEPENYLETTEQKFSIRPPTVDVVYMLLSKINERKAPGLDNVNGCLSSSAPVTCGVPQRSNLGPLLFLVDINDLLNCLSAASPRMFADDTNISYATNTLSELEKVINSELKNMKRWLKQIN